MSRLLEKTNVRVTQKFKPGIHNGIDLVGNDGKHNVGDRIRAHSNGVVVGLRKDYKTTDKIGHSYGNYVLIRHNNGMYTLYAHLKYNTVTCEIGTNVMQGEIIGTMGATGHSTAVHLHFEVRNEKNVKIDPTPYLESDLPNNEPKKEEPKEEPKKESTSKDSELLNLVRRTIRGDFGNGENRKRNLGSKYSEVQRQVDLNIKKKTTNWDKVKIYK